MISDEDVMTAVEQMVPETELTELTESTSPKSKSNLEGRHSWADDIPIKAICWPGNPEVRSRDEKTGDPIEVQGVNPWHGSENGKNFTVNIVKNAWYCFHNGDESGGGPIEAIAVSEGLIDCSEAIGGWRQKYPGAFKQACLQAKEMGYKVPSSFTKDRIEGRNRDLEEVSDEGLAALIKHNDPPELFIRGGALTRLKNVDDRITLDIITAPMLKGMLARSASWGASTTTKKGNYIFSHMAPPSVVTEDILSLPSWPGLPKIRAIVETPIIRRDGSIVLTPGYDEETQLYYVPAHDLVIPDMPEYPTQKDAKEAIDWLQAELLIDFPFDGKNEGISASRANAIGALLTLMMRPLIDGKIPMALFDKPKPGTGASLLMELFFRIATGKAPSYINWPEKDDELQKRIEATLLEGRLDIPLDNIDRVIKSSFLNMVMTAPSILIRILGTSKVVEIPECVNVMGTGNNIQTWKDFKRRVYPIRVDAEMARPQDRPVEGFHHPNIIDWVRENRGLILSKLLTIIRAWYVAGCKPGKNMPPLGSFEKWVKTIGSILQWSGVQGFLTNLGKTWDDDLESQEWEVFLQVWQGFEYKGKNGATIKLKDEYLSVNDLISIINQSDVLRKALPAQLSKFDLNSKATSRIFGYTLAKHADERFISDLHMVKREDKKACSMTWKVAGKL